MGFNRACHALSKYVITFAKPVCHSSRKTLSVGMDACIVLILTDFFEKFSNENLNVNIKYDREF